MKLDKDRTKNRRRGEKKVKIKKCIFLFCSLLCIFLFSGCWDKQEIKHSAIVLGTAYDWLEDGSYLLTVEVVDAMGEEGGNVSSAVISGAGHSLTEAMTDLSRRMNRPFDWSHNNVMIIGRDLAEHGIANFLNLLSKQYPMRPRVYVVMSEGRGEDILKGKIGIEKMTSAGIAQMIQVQGKKSGHASKIFLVANFLEDCLNSSIVPVIPVMAVEEGQVLLRPYWAVIEDDAFYGFLTEEETKGAFWLRNLYAGEAMNIEDDFGNLYGLEVQSSKSRWQWEHGVDGRLQIQVSFVVESIVKEMNVIGNQNGQEMDVARLEQKQQEQILKEVQAVWRKNLHMEKDFTGLEQEIYRKDYPYWQQIQNTVQQVFADASLQIEIHNTILYTGNKE